MVENEDRDNEYGKLGYDKESELAKETLLDEEIRYEEEVLVPSQKIAMADSNTLSLLVCRYSPGGNYYGETPY